MHKGLIAFLIIVVLGIYYITSDFGCSKTFILWDDVLEREKSLASLNYYSRIGEFGIVLRSDESLIHKYSLPENAVKSGLGQIVYHGKSYLTDGWWISAFSGAVIVVIVLAFYLIGDGMNNILSPKLQKYN